MKHINDRYSTFCSLVLTLLSVVGGLLVLTACQGSDSLRPTPPSLTLSQGKIFVQYTNTADYVYDSLAVFRADTGAFLWKAPDFIDPPVADNTTVYSPTKTTLIARNAESGKELWHTSGPLVPSVVLNGIVYAAYPVNGVFSLFALQANDGSQLWTAKLSGSYVRHVEAEQGHMYVLTDDGFFVLHLDDGKLLWSVTRIGFGSAFTSANGMIYLSRSNDNVLDALQGNNGKVLWTFHAPRVLGNSVLTPDGILCLNAVDALYGLRTRDGKQVWRLPGNSIGEFASNILTANGVVYVPSSHEGLLAIQARDGTERWRFNPGGAVSSINLDSTTGILYTTIVLFAPTYVAAVQTNGQFLWKIQPQLISSAFQETNGVVYQVLPSGVAGDSNEKKHYTQFDLTATRGSDGKSLWSTHFPF